MNHKKQTCEDQSFTCHSSRGVWTSSEHPDWSVWVEEFDPLEGGSLLAVTEPQLTLAIATAGKHFSLSCEENTQTERDNLSSEAEGKQAKYQKQTWADQCVVSSTCNKLNFLRLQSWEIKRIVIKSLSAFSLKMQMWQMAKVKSSRAVAKM